MLARNNGILPYKYEGKYEEHLRLTGQSVNMLYAEQDATKRPEDDQKAQPPACGDGCHAFLAQEHPETGNISDIFFAFSEANSSPPGSQTAVSNSFQNLVQADCGDDFDAEDVAEAMKQLTSHVTVGPRTRQAPKGPKAYTKKQIMQIAADIANGKIQLPDLDLESNEMYEAVWALVDSGSSVHVVDVERVLPGAKTKKPDPRSPGFKTACGGTVPDRGSADVPFVTAEGHEYNISWRNAPVAMPILSTRLLAQDKGELRYQTDGGQVVNTTNGEQDSCI